MDLEAGARLRPECKAPIWLWRPTRQCNIRNERMTINRRAEFGHLLLHLTHMILAVRMGPYLQHDGMLAAKLARVHLIPSPFIHSNTIVVEM